MSFLNNYTAKLNLLLDLNPSWAYGAINAEQAMLAKLLGAQLQGEKGLLYMQTALDLAALAWQQRPLDFELVALLQMLLEAGARFDSPASPDAPEAHDAPASDSASAPSFAATIQGLDAAFKLAQIKGNPGKLNLAHNQEALQNLLRTLPDFAGKEFVAARYQAEYLLQSSPPDALNLIATLPDQLFWGWKCLALLEADQTSLDLGLLKKLWQKYFWHTNLTLALHDLLYPSSALSGQAISADGSSAASLPPILLYSWNKRDVLYDTLVSLRASGTGAAPVFVLDNGSSDGSAAMLAAQKDLWGTPFTIINLPSNVGAPAARNWLLSLPQVKQATSTIFLDDDVILTPDWLNSLLNTAAANPGFGAIGCRVTDHIPPYGIQAADFYLLAAAEATHSFTDLEEEIFPFCPATGQTSNFLFSYTRPCASVTGCCHLLNMQAIAEAGAFDVRFNPSQFDDLERDLRSTLAGWPTIYHGQTVIRHVQHSSLRQALSLPQQAHIMGNKIKLEFLLDKTKAAKLRDQTLQRVKDDLLRKCAKVQAALEL